MFMIDTLFMINYTVLLQQYCCNSTVATVLYSTVQYCIYIYGALWGPRVPIYGALWGPRVPGLMDPGLRDPGPRVPGLRDPGPRVPGLRDPGPGAQGGLRDPGPGTQGP